MSISYETYTGSDREVEAVRLCELCADAFREEGWLEGDIPPELAEFGADIADHLCDRRETDDRIHCDCACNKRR